MNYETNIHMFWYLQLFWQLFQKYHKLFVHGFNSEQRFHQTHGQMMIKQGSSLQHCITMRCYLIKNANFSGKKWYLVFNVLFAISNAV